MRSLLFCELLCRSVNLKYLYCGDICECFDSNTLRSRDPIMPLGHLDPSLVGVSTALRRLSTLPSIPTLNPSSPSPTPFPLNETSSTISDLHVIDWTTNILNILQFQHTVDHRCFSQLRQDNWHRSLRASVCCRTRQSNSPEAILQLLQEREKALRTREGIQRVSRRKSQID